MMGKTSWTDQEQHKMTQFNIDYMPRCGCSICGSMFRVGDIFRWVYTVGVKPPITNILVCVECDIEDKASMIKLAQKSYLRFKILQAVWID